MNREQALLLFSLSDVATIDDVERVYRELSTVWDPARFSNDAQLKVRAMEMMAQVQEAYSLLKASFVKIPSSGGCAVSNNVGYDSSNLVKFKTSKPCKEQLQCILLLMFGVLLVGVFGYFIGKGAFSLLRLRNKENLVYQVDANKAHANQIVENHGTVTYASSDNIASVSPSSISASSSSASSISSTSIVATESFTPIAKGLNGSMRGKEDRSNSSNITGIEDLVSLSSEGNNNALDIMSTEEGRLVGGLSGSNFSQSNGASALSDRGKNIVIENYKDKDRMYRVSGHYNVQEVIINSTPNIVDAAARCDVKELDALIKNGASVSEIDDRGDTALIWAVRSRCLSGVKLLLNSKADVNHSSLNGFTAYVWARIYQHGQIMKLLEKAGADTTVGWYWWRNDEDTKAAWIKQSMGYLCKSKSCK